MNKVDRIFHYLITVGWFTPTVTVWVFGYMLIFGKPIISDLGILINLTFTGPMLVVILGGIHYAIRGNTIMLLPGCKYGKIGALSFLWSIPSVFVLDWLIGKLLPTYSSAITGFERTAITLSLIFSLLFTIFVLVILRDTVTDNND